MIRALRILVALIAFAALPAPGLAQDWSAGMAEARALVAPPDPLALYEAAARRFNEGDRADATFLFYLGQLHWRADLIANPDQPPDGGPALFGALNETLGRPINEWAFGDLDMLRALLRDVHGFDLPPNPRMARAFARSRAGLAELITYIEANAAEIRRDRTANGLENR